MPSESSDGRWGIGGRRHGGRAHAEGGPLIHASRAYTRLGSAATSAVGGEGEDPAGG